MALQQRIQQSLSKRQQRAYRLALNLYRIEGVLIAAFPILAMLGLLAIDSGQNPDLVISLCLGSFSLLLTVRYFLLSQAMQVIFRSAYNAGLNIRSKIIHHLAQLPLGSFRQLHTGKVAQTLSEDLTHLETYISHTQPLMTADRLVVICLFSAVLILNPIMALAALSTFALGKLVLYWIETRILRRGMQQRSAGLSEASRHILEFAEGMPVIRTFGDTPTAERDYQNSVAQMRAGFRKGVKRIVPVMSLANGLSMLAVASGAIAGILTLPADELADIHFLAAIILLTALLVPARAAIAHRLIEVLGQLAERNLSEIEQVNPITAGRQQHIPKHASIEFHDVSFAYEQDNVINKVSFRAQPKSLTAIVGSSGSGKTTLMNLLLRFWDVQQGKITLNNTDIREFALADYMNHIAAVFQETRLFHDTVTNNIRVGKPDANDAEIIAAAQAACIHERILSLPQGYDTVIGHGGSTLSGGERQRITIARALLKDADIVILDEATAALDPENEHEVQRAFNALAQDKTVFVIAHRLSTVVAADTILLLDNGQIVDQGTHDTLLSRSTLYQKLWQNYVAISDWQL